MFLLFLLKRLSCKHVFIVLILFCSIPQAAKAEQTLRFLEGYYSGEGEFENIRLLGRIAISPDQKNVYVTSYFNDAVTVFIRDIATGKLQFLEDHVNDQNGVHGLGGAWGIVISADGKYVYIGGTTIHTVTLFSRNQATGALTYKSTLPVGNSQTTYHLVISPDGSNLYVSDNQYVTAYSRNSDTGALSLVQYLFRRGTTTTGDAVDFALSPDGAYAYIGLADPMGIRIAGRNQSTGVLTSVQTINFPSALFTETLSFGFSPDSNQLYACGFPVQVFARDRMSGALTVIQTIDPQIYPNFDYYASSNVIVSPDGSFVLLLGGHSGHDIALFERNSSDGTLRFLTGINDRRIEAADIATAVLSQDGHHIYVFAESELTDSEGIGLIAIESINSARNWNLYQ